MRFFRKSWFFFRFRGFIGYDRVVVLCCWIIVRLLYLFWVVSFSRIRVLFYLFLIFRYFFVYRFS